MTTTSDPLPNGTIQASRIPRSTSSTLNERKPHPRNDETISPITRKSKDNLFNRSHAPIRRLGFPQPPSSTSTNGSQSSSNRRTPDSYLILNPKDDKSDRRVILIPPPNALPVRVGRVVNVKTPAKFDNLLFDTKVLSRNHAEVFQDQQGRVFIRDLGSSNGTYINGLRLSADAVPSEPFPLMPGQELALGIDIRDETNQETIAYHKVWFTVEHVGPTTSPQPDLPTPNKLGAVDLDPWIPKPSTKEIVGHLLEEITAAKQIAEEITCVQNMLDGMMEGTAADGGVIEKVQKELEEKTRRVEELEGLLGVEREERRILEERIRIMEDERALKVMSLGENGAEPDGSKEADEALEETAVDITDSKDDIHVKDLVIPDVDKLEEQLVNGDQPDKVHEEKANSAPSSPSTIPSSPFHESSTRSISPMSLPSTESSAPDNTALLDKISHLESQLATAQEQIEMYKAKLTESSPIIRAVSKSMPGTSSSEFPFTFTAPPSSPRTPQRRTAGSLRRRKPSMQGTKPTTVSKFTEDNVEEIAAKDVTSGKEGNKEFIEGLCAALGVVVLGWMGMWIINQMVERGEKVVK